jgi:hypothetical protein
MDTNFVDTVTPIVASWLNDINDHTYNNTPIAPATTVHPASVIANTPAGNITSATVQLALNELDTKKGAVASTLAQFAATTSAQLAATISDETGTGALVFATNPVLVTPALGTPSSGVATNLTGTATGLTAGNATTAATVSTTVASGAVGTTQAPLDNSTRIATTAYVNAAVVAANGLGVSQVWSDVTGSRALTGTGASFTNSTTKPIQVHIVFSSTSLGGGTSYFVVGGVHVAAFTPSTQYMTISVIVPVGLTYGFSLAAGGGTLTSWAELS